MAATITSFLQKAFPNRLKYELNTTGVGTGTLNVTQAALIADCVPGALKTALSSAPVASGSWPSLLTGQTFTGQLFSGMVSCYINMGDGAALSTIFGATFLNGTPNVMVISVDGSPAGVGIASLELVFIHSIVQ